jgi:F0F1-type ATP synthase assembly protein I
MLDHLSFAVKDYKQTLKFYSVSILKFKQRLIKKLLLQFVVLAILSISLSFWRVFFAVSFGFGTLIPLFAHGIFALVIFQKTSNHGAKMAMQKFYLGELLKWCFTGLCFWLAFQWQNVVAVGLFLGFIVAQVLSTLLLVQMEIQKKRR